MVVTAIHVLVQLVILVPIANHMMPALIQIVKTVELVHLQQLDVYVNAQVDTVEIFVKTILIHAKTFLV